MAFRMKNIVPVVMAGVIGIYGLIVAVLISGNVDSPQSYDVQLGYINVYNWDRGWFLFRLHVRLTRINLHLA